MALIEPGWIQQVFDLAKDIERSEQALFEFSNILSAFSNAIQAVLPFEFIAIQLFNKEDRTIQTIHATGTQGGLVGLAKHSIDGDDNTLDIQASVFRADPPKIKIISGWDSHFDRLIYKQFDHASIVRTWTPIIVLKDAMGNIISDWPSLSPWGDNIIQWQYTERIDGQHVYRFSIDIPLNIESLEQKYGPVYIERIGTVEAGHYRLIEGITRETAICLADMVIQLAISWNNSSFSPSLNGDLPTLREASLDYVLEKTAESAMRVLGGTAATLHFFDDEVRGRYVYEVSSGIIGPRFLANHPPRKNGLGRQAIEKKRPLIVPDVAAGQDINHLQTANLPAWELGIRMMAAFPLIVDNNYGVLYIGFDHYRLLLEYEYDVINRFLGRAIQGIRTSTYHKNALDENRRLINLNSISQSLVSQHTDRALLENIAGNASNLLASDFVTIHEYISNSRTFLDAAVAGHCRDPDSMYYIINKHISAQHLIQQNAKGIIDQDLEGYATIHDLPDDVRQFTSSEGFIRRLCIPLKYGDEALGVMFVYYRRRCRLLPQDIKAAEMLAAHAVIAMRIRRAYYNVQAALKRREKELNALSAIDQHFVANPGDLETAHCLILHNALDILGAESGAIVMYDSWAQKLDVATSQSYPTDDSFLHVHFGQGVVGQAARDKQPCLVEDILDPPWRSIYNTGIPVARSELAVPLLDETGFLGVLNVRSTNPRSISENDKILLNMLAVQATIAIHIVKLVQRLNKTIRALEALGVIAVRAQRPSYDRDTIIRLFLTGVTAVEGLGLSRAMLFLKNTNGDALKGAMGIGELEKKKADECWKSLSDEREYLQKIGSDVLEVYLNRAEKLSGEIKDGVTEDSPLSRAIRTHTQPVESYGRAVAECLQSRCCKVVQYNENDGFREVLAKISNQLDEGAAFICVPVGFRDRVLGVMVADRRFLTSERQSDFDETALLTYANILGVSLENERLQKNAATYQLYNETGHDLSGQLSALTSLISCLDFEVKKVPHLREIFWNVRRGDYLEQMVRIKDDLKRFARDLRTIGAPISLTCCIVNLNTIIEDWLSRVKLAWLASELERIHDVQDDRQDEQIERTIEDTVIYKPCHKDILVNVDTWYIRRAVELILENAKHAVRNVENPRIIVKLKDEGTSFISLSISDNGEGVRDARKEQIFSPFFTTRPHGIGAGLGLTSARRFVEAHGGMLQEVGEYGKGAVFVMKLPLCGALVQPKA